LNDNQRDFSIPFTEYDLANGLHVILSPNKLVPLVVTNLWYHVGAKDDPPMRTGFAHLFEHMMFQGSKNVPKAAHFKYIQSAGGLLNATTSTDRTNYFETLPSGELELALWLESDRMLSLDVTKDNFENQRAVVKEERRQRYDNKPYGTVWENMASRIWPEGCYHSTTIGSMEHLDDATIDDCIDFHAEYYKPNNCSLTIAGSFDEDHARRLIDRYFGSIPAGKPVNRTPQIIYQTAQEVRFTMEDAVKLPAVYIAVQGTPAFEREEYVLDLLGDILDGGKSSRFYQELTYKREIAREIGAFNYAMEKGGAIVLDAKVQSNSTPEEVEEALWAEIEKLRDEPVTDMELAKVKNRAEMRAVSSLVELGPRADRLQRGWTLIRETGRVNRELDFYRSVTAEEIQAAAQKYFHRERRVVAYVLPK
jgi:zinc protease